MLPYKITASSRLSHIFHELQTVTGIHGAYTQVTTLTSKGRN